MQIWVDASFNPKTKEAGLGILIRQLVKGGTKETRLNLKTKAEDNNQAELLAVYYALQNIKGSSKEEPIFIITDSKIAIDTPMFICYNSFYLVYKARFRNNIFHLIYVFCISQ